MSSHLRKSLVAARSSSQLAFTPSFGEGFLDHHAGSIISDPHYAITELVANAWDAGALRVDIEWPTSAGAALRIADNGTGMTAKEFRERWRTLSYDRLKHEGALVTFPPGAGHRLRQAFGRNGVGRHAMFCFGPDYEVETTKGGKRVRFAVSRTAGGATPFTVRPLENAVGMEGHGTVLSTTCESVHISAGDITRLLGTKFVADPEFRIFVNSEEITLTDLDSLCEVTTIEVPNVGTLVVRRYDSERSGRTSMHHGVVWWVNRRRVTNPSWDGYDGSLLDARGAVGKRFTYVIEADPLVGPPGRPFVKKDWSGFHATPEVLAAQKAVANHIRDDLRVLLSELRRDRKREALRTHRHLLRDLPPISQDQIARFTEEIQVNSPTITERDLTNAVQVLASLERARTGYSLLEKLASLPSDDLDGLDAILGEWSVSDAREVLGELRYRLRLIKQLEALVELHTTDELHDLQPLFERGLWIFGPRFESVSFTSNRTLTTVLQQLLSPAPLKTPRHRPDFVVLPDSSLGIYSAERFDAKHEVDGLSNVVIVELKRGGFPIGHKEKDQGLDYARELRKSGRVSKTTDVLCYVLGTTVDPDAEEETTEGPHTRIIARRYADVLAQAHARTFRLLERIEGSPAVRVGDADLADLLDQEELVLGGTPTP
jgi:hypothetical protein